MEVYIRTSLDLPGGTADKNSPASAGDMGSIPGQGRSHTPCVPQLPSPCAASPEARAPRFYAL